MQIATSILNSNDRIEDVIKLNRTNTSYIHIDVMDGKFVDDIQFSVKEIGAINRVVKYPMDVHLMVNNPIEYINKLGDMNIEYITFHVEIKKDKKKIISKIKELGYKVGISIKPDTNLEELIPFLKDIDMILVMSVEPGLGGQKFMGGTVKRIKELKKLINDGGYDIKIEVDGGINYTTIVKVKDVDIAVVGSYIVRSNNFYRRVEELLDLVIEKSISKKIEVSKLISNILIFVGLFLILISFCFEFGTNSYNFLKSIYRYPIVFFSGFCICSIGIFIKPFHKINVEIRKDKHEILVKRSLLYKVLLILGLIPFIFIFGFWLFLMIVEKEQLSFYLFMMASSFVIYLPIWLLGLLLIVISIVRLNEIKRLSKK